MIGKHANDEGLAYTFVMWIVLALVIAPGMYIILMHVVDLVLLTGVNPLIDTGVISEQSKQAIMFTAGALSILPLVLIGASLLFATNQGVLTYNRGPGVFQAFSAGFILLIVVLLTAFLLSVLAAVYVDGAMIPAINTLDNVSDLDPTSKWAIAQESQGNFLFNLVYFFIHALVLLGYAGFLISSYRRTAGETYRGY